MLCGISQKYVILAESVVTMNNICYIILWGNDTVNDSINLVIKLKGLHFFNIK